MKSLRGLIVLSVLTAAMATAVAAGQQQDGIKVHGHWTMDVRNPDGTLVSHHEFENSLDSGGPVILAGTLGLGWTPSDWRILVGDVCTVTAGPAPCMILVTPSAPLNGTVPAGTIELAGTATAMLNGSVLSVATDAVMAVPMSPPQRLRFTSHTLTAPVAVVTGQIIQVRVVISFS